MSKSKNMKKESRPKKTKDATVNIKKGKAEISDDELKKVSGGASSNKTFSFGE